MKPITIQWSNWHKRQARLDYKNVKWFKFYTNFFLDPDAAILSPGEKLFCIFLLAESAKSNKSGKLTVSSRLASGIVGLDEDTFFSTIEKLKEIKWLKVVSSEDVTEPARNRNETVPEPSENVPLELRVKSKEFLPSEEIIHTSAAVAPDPNENGFQVKKKRTAEAASLEHPLIGIWNQHCGKLPKVVTLGSDRKKKTQKAWQDNPSPDHWIKIAQVLAKDDFCNGKGPTAWIANFEYFLSERAMVRAFEGTQGKKKNQGYVFTYTTKEEHA